MELKVLRCPNCDASLDVDDGLDTFYCKYCGYKIILSNQSRAAYEAKVRIMDMKHKEIIQDKIDAQERFKMEFKQKDERKTILTVLGLFAVIGFIIAIILVIGNTGAKRQEEKLQAIVDEIIVDIANEDYGSTYVKANSLYWDNSWTDEGEDKWNATRNAIIKQIEEAEKNSTGTVTNPIEEKGSFWNLFK